MKDYSNYVTMEIKLPKHIAEWLQEFSRELAKTPDQVLIHILTYYYEAWRVGYEAGLKSSTAAYKETHLLDSSGLHVDSSSIVSTLNDILNEYIAKCKCEARYKAKRRWIIEMFISWIAGRLHRLDPEELRGAIREFLDEYQRSRDVSKKTLNVYRNALSDFVEYVCSRLKQRVEGRDR